MSLHSLDGQPVGATLQTGHVDMCAKGSDLRDFERMTANGEDVVEELVWETGTPYSCQEDEYTFGMPTWLFWTMVAVVVAIIVAVVATNVVGGRHERRCSR